MIKQNWLLDFHIRNYTGCGHYQEDIVRSIYAADFIIKEGKIEVIQIEFTEEEIKEKLEHLITKAREGYNPKHKFPLGDFINYREVKNE